MVEWSAPSDTGLGQSIEQEPISNYTLIATSKLTSQIACKYQGFDLHFICTGLVSGAGYIFSIRAINVAGTSDPTNVFKISLGDRPVCAFSDSQ